MTSSCMEIKEKRGNFIVKGIFWLFLALASLLCALLPYISAYASEKKLWFFLVGGAAFVFFTTLFVMLLVREIRPGNAMVLNSRGFRCASLLGSDMEIEWTNVAGIGVFGTKKTPLFGIRLENSDIVLARLGKKAADEMRDNLSENLPAMLIAQSDIRMPLTELKELFNKFIRESRALEESEPQKPKANPFTSEDVIRAFGGTESDVASLRTKTVPETPKQVAPAPISPAAAAAAAAAPASPASPVPAAVGASVKEASADRFYEMLVEKASEPIKTESASPEAKAPIVPDVPAAPTPEAPAKSEDEEEVITDEMRELLSAVKVTRVSELEKLLNDNGIPFSASRQEKAADEAPQEAAAEPSDASRDDESRFACFDIPDEEEIKTEKPKETAPLVPDKTELSTAAPAAEDNDAVPFDFSEFARVTETEKPSSPAPKEAAAPRPSAEYRPRVAPKPDRYPDIVMIDDDDEKPKKKRAKKRGDPTDSFFVADIDDK